MAPRRAGGRALRPRRAACALVYFASLASEAFVGVFAEAEAFVGVPAKAEAFVGVPAEAEAFVVVPAEAEARRPEFEVTVSIRGAGATSREMTFVMDAPGSSRGFLHAAGVEGPKCAADAIGAAAAAVSRPLFVGRSLSGGETFSIAVRWGESPGASVRAALEARARSGRVMRPGCDFWGRGRFERVALCALPPGGFTSVIAGEDLAPFGFEPRAGITHDPGHWPASHAEADTVVVCSAFTSAESRASVAAFVAHAIGTLGARHVYLYDVDADEGGSNVAAAYDAIAPSLRLHATILRLPQGLRTRTDALRACVFSSGHDAAWVLYMEPSERLVLPDNTPTLGALASSVVFAAADAVMFRECGSCALGVDVAERDLRCMRGRPLLRFGRVSVAGVRSSCAASPSLSVDAAGRIAAVDHAACGDTPGDIEGSACDDATCTGAYAHICVTSDPAGLRVGTASGGEASCTTTAEPRIRRHDELDHLDSPESGARRLVKAWSARPRTRAPRLAYATIAYGDVDAWLPRLAFALANWREVSPATDRVAIVPRGSVWTSRIDVTAAATSAFASLVPMPEVLPPHRCHGGDVGEKDPESVAQYSNFVRPSHYFSGTYLLVRLPHRAKFAVLFF